MSEKLIIIGGVAAGMKTAAKARREKPDLEIVVYQEEEVISYAGCGLTYYISDVISDRGKLVHRTADQMKEKSNIDVYTNHRVIKIIPETKEIAVLNLKTKEEFTTKYDKLVIATGASPKVPDIKGISSNNVHFLKSITDADKIKVASKAIKNVIVAGAGFLGLEIAEAFKEMNKEVNLIVGSDQVLREFDKDIAYHVLKYMKEKGINVYTSENLIAIETDENSNLTKVVTDKQEIKADMVIICKGVKPNTDIAKEAGIELGLFGGIKVDDNLKTSIEDIYAGGDCVETKFLLNNKGYAISSGSIANKHGKVIAENITGKKSTFKGSLKTRIVKIFDMTVARVGYSEKEAKKEAIDYEVALIAADDIAHYYPGAQKIVLKMLAEKNTHKIIGLQSFGLGEVSKRIDVASIVITAGMTVEQVSQADLTYAPPYSPAMDAIIVCANVLANKLTGKSKSIMPLEFLEKMNNKPDSYVLIDVRPPDGYKEGKIKGAINIPFGQLRNRLDELDKNKEIIIHCRIGKMSYVAYRVLKNNGFENIKYLDGGVTGWIDELEPVK
ncbi:MAG: FAD-dependent oxidoreductase [Cyanobacteriota bacterium]